MEQGVLNLKPNLATVEIKVADIGDLTEELAYDADVLLGYTGLRKQLGLAGPLGKVLVELEIKPFDKEQVEAYKDQAESAKVKEIQATVDRHHQFDVYRHVNWVESPLRGYEGQVPQFVLDRARSIKKKLPGVEFLVDALTVDEVALDPFLVAVLGDERYVVSVWDEPDFEEEQYKQD
jgi:hypothetical protein